MTATKYEPTEEDIKAHNMMMETLTNLSAHLHFAQGWWDATLPFHDLINRHDIKLMPELVNRLGNLKLANKAIGRVMIKSDDNSIDLMFQEIGMSVSTMFAMDLDQRDRFRDKLNKLYEETVAEIIQTNPKYAKS